MGVIRVLPPDLVNRIAAGECVERPASVIKELVENALDAGATQIDVAVLDGGRELIRVADDGCGIAREDLPLAVHPHATSKIRQSDDLFDIHTMGFRGEALASIGAVSRLSITSRTAASDVAFAMTVEGGRATDPAPTAGRVGTIIEVRDLFFSVPARRKFLKTNPTESGHITEQIARIALAYPNVGFSLRSQNRVVHELPPTESRQQRVRDFYGPELADVLLPVRREGGGVCVEGLVAPPRESRGAGKWEYVFVNGRFVRDRFVSHAIKEAYRSLIEPGRFPVVFLFITITPGDLDVNVHPTKIEVRWRDSNYVHAQVLAALRDKFLSSNLDHQLRPPREDDAYRERVRQAMVDFFRGQPHGASAPRQQSFAGYAATSTPVDELMDRRMPAAAPGAPEPPAARREIERGEPAAAAPETPQAAPAAFSDLGRALQVHNTYLVVETQDGLMIIDQHALHERILYEELQRRITQRPLESQRLLIPDVVRVPEDRIESLETHSDTLARLGVELTQVGPGRVALHAFPSLLDRVNREEFVRDLLDKLSERGARPAADTLVHELVDMMACKAAVKAGDPLTPDEIASLLARRELAERSSHCPHGRPTTLHFPLRELEKQFKRR